jgi:hypothetical protein
MAKVRPDSAIAALTEEQRNQLYDWLLSHSYPEVIDLAAKSESDGGFNIKFHRTTLIRFFNKQREELQAQELAELAARSDINEIPERINLLIKAAQTHFAQATYELAKAANNSDDYERLDRALHHMEFVRVKREELALERERMIEQKRQWEFDATREVMRNLVEYQRIHKQPGVDEPEKIWLAREVAFGKDPNRTTEAPSPVVNYEDKSAETAPVVPSSGPSASDRSETPAANQTQSDTKRHDLHENGSGEPAPVPLQISVQSPQSSKLVPPPPASAA